MSKVVVVVSIVTVIIIVIIEVKVVITQFSIHNLWVVKPEDLSSQCGTGGV